MLATCGCRAFVMWLEQLRNRIYFYSIVIGLNLNGHILVATVLDGTDVKVTTGIWDSQLIGVLTWVAGYWLAVQGPLPLPICPPRSALEKIAVFALLGPTASCQQMTKLIKHAVHPPVPSFLLMTFGHTRTNLYPSTQINMDFYLQRNLRLFDF